MGLLKIHKGNMGSEKMKRLWDLFQIILGFTGIIVAATWASFLFNPAGPAEGPHPFLFRFPNMAFGLITAFGGSALIHFTSKWVAKAFGHEDDWS